MEIHKHTMLWNLIREVPLPGPGQRAVLDLGSEAIDALTANYSCDITDDVWTELWGKKLSASSAANLVSRRLSPERIDQVLKKEKRVTVLSAMAVHNRLSEDQLRLAIKQVKTLAAKIPRDPNWSQGMVRDVMVASGGTEALSALIQFTFTDGEARKVLREWFTVTSRPRWETYRLLVQVLAKFPNTIGEFCSPDAPEVMWTTAAGSSLLADERHQKALLDVATGHANGDLRVHSYPLLALLNNPRTARHIVQTALGRLESNTLELPHIVRRSVESAIARLNDGSRPQVTVPFSEVSDEKVLSWLVARATGKPAVRAFDLEALAYNPNLTDSQACSVLWKLHDEFTVEVLGLERTLDAFNHLRSKQTKTGEVLPLTPPSDNRRAVLPRRVISHRWDKPTLDKVPWEVYVYDPQEQPVENFRVCSKWLGSPDGAGLVQPQQWSVLFTLLDDVDPNQPLADVVKAAKLLAV